MPVYVLDSNFFIQAHRFHYPIAIKAWAGFTFFVTNFLRQTLLCSLFGGGSIWRGKQGNGIGNSLPKGMVGLVESAPSIGSKVG